MNHFFHWFSIFSIGGAIRSSMKSWSTALGCAAISSITLWRPVSTAAISSLVGLNSASVSEFNASSQGVLIDRRFQIKERPYVDKPLNETSYKMIALLYMGDLALQDWDSSLPGSISPRPSEYPGVVILGGPEPSISGEQIPVHFLIWSLNLAMYISITRNRYVETTFDILWSDQKIGRLGFRHMYPQAQKMGQSNQSSSLGVPPTRSALTFQPVRILVLPIPDSRPLDPNSVWLLLYAATQHFAWANKRTILDHTIEIRPRSTNFMIRFIADVGPDGPRRSPPYLQYWMIIAALGQVPEWMLSDRGSFREVEFGIYASGTYVGTGSVELDTRPEALQLSPNSNVTTS